MACFSAPGLLPLQLAGRVTVFPATVAVMVFPFGRNLAANTISKGQQNRSAHFEDLVAKLVIALVEQFLGFRQRRRIQQVNLTLARQIGFDLQDCHAASGQNFRLQKLRLARIVDCWTPQRGHRFSSNGNRRRRIRR